MTIYIASDVAVDIAVTGALAAIPAAMLLLSEDLVPTVAELDGLRWIEPAARTRYLNGLQQDLEDLASWVADFESVVDAYATAEQDCE